MKQRKIASTARLQGLHLAPAAHERALLALAALGFLAWWMTQGRDT